ncbi:hypothetical protein LJR164_001651 [Phenylobacterium sp. LjRoot164]|uniref:hypothetical protein n=1 Tax=unclassified Phenylobacterium TaxID=2640670 RepID=UPI003ECE8AF4
MRRDLDEIREGLEFCKTKNAELVSKIREFADTNVQIIIDGHPSHFAHVTARLKADLPSSFGREAGLLMNETRAQLDHLANALARRAGANSDDASYPILSGPEKVNAEARRKLRQLADADRDLVLHLQPFSEQHPLEALTYLHNGDNFRKHRKPLGLSVLGSVAMTGSGHIGMMVSGQTEALTRAGQTTDVMHCQGVTVPLAFGYELEVLEPADMRGYFITGFIEEAINAVGVVVEQFN